MSSRSMRLLSVMFVLCGTAASAQTPAPLPGGVAGTLGQQVAAITAEPGVARAHWGIAVTEMDGTAVYGLNEGEYFRPASNAKLFTTAAAMHLLGPETRITTALEGTLGTLRGQSTIAGDLLLRGAGDANISGRTIPYVSAPERRRRAEAGKAAGVTEAVPNPLRYFDEMADGLYAAGVRRVRGNVVGDDTLWPWEPYANDWTIDDAIWGYGAPTAALTVLDNQIEVKVAAGSAVGKPPVVSVTPAAPAYYKLDLSGLKTAAAGTGNRVRWDRPPGSRVLRIYGTIGVDTPPDSEEVAIEDPAEYAAMAMRDALVAHGIHVDGQAKALHRQPVDAGGFSEQVHEPLPQMRKQAIEAGISRLLTGAQSCMDACPERVEHRSPTMAEDVAVTLKVSQNLHAELLLRRLGKQYGTDGSLAQGARVVRQFLLNAGVDGDDFVFYDGSGLSGHDLVTPRATAKLLSFAATQPWFALWKAGLPVGGEDGTLAGRFPKPPLKDHLFAKTGTLSEARALSGYVDCASGKTMIFSVMVDNHAPNTPADRNAMDRIVAAIAATN